MPKHNANNERIKRRYFSYLKEAKRHSETTVDAVAKADIFEYIEVFYNRQRRHSYLGYLSPADFEKKNAA